MNATVGLVPFSVFCALFLASAGGVDAQEDDWFPWESRGDAEPSVIDASAWLDKPAGKHGFVQMDGGSLRFEDGTPAKFWGAVGGLNRNLTGTPELIEQSARRWAKYGINCVRLHRFAGPGRGGSGSVTDLGEARFARLDALSDALRRRGIYYTWSHIGFMRVGQGDRERLLAYDEIIATGGETTGLVNFAPDIQDLQIELTVNLLNHLNPITGLRYADDPALAYVELQNEDDILAGPMHERVVKCPTYKKLLEGMFSDWLEEKYGGQEGLEAAWGPRALNAYDLFEKDESLDARNIYPISHPWWHGPDGMKQAGELGATRRMLDALQFLHEVQDQYYGRYVAAIRATGYRGAIVTSCWQAGSGVPHCVNLYSDYEFGLIDRHNYYGGRTGHRMTAGPVFTGSMLDRPGSGLLSSAFQQVVDRPFALSEWIVMLPDPYEAEGPPLIAAYGMGLQGWDASFESALQLNEFAPSLTSTVVYSIDIPNEITLYPALSRMIYRGDVKEGPVVARRTVSVPDLLEGRLSFQEQVGLEGDVKAIQAETPSEALAIGKVVIEFTKVPEPPEQADLSTYWDPERKLVRSATGQLEWHYDGGRYVTLDTPGTQGVVGFTGGKVLRVGDVMIQTSNPFSVVLISSLDKVQTIPNARSLLVTAVARVRNTGQEFSEDGTELVDPGEGPILVEPVAATIQLRRPGIPRVRVLDHDGCRTDRTVPVEATEEGARFEIGGQYRAVYYEIVYP